MENWAEEQPLSGSRSISSLPRRIRGGDLQSCYAVNEENGLSPSLPQARGCGLLSSLPKAKSWGIL